MHTFSFPLLRVTLADYFTAQQNNTHTSLHLSVYANNNCSFYQAAYKYCSSIWLLADPSPLARVVWVHIDRLLVFFMMAPQRKFVYRIKVLVLAIQNFLYRLIVTVAVHLEPLFSKQYTMPNLLDRSVQAMTEIIKCFILSMVILS